jgi:hypothetical protein
MQPRSAGKPLNEITRSDREYIIPMITWLYRYICIVASFPKA